MVPSSDLGIAFTMAEVVPLVRLKTLKQQGVFSPDDGRASSLPRTPQRPLKYVFKVGRLGGLFLGC